MKYEVNDYITEYYLDRLAGRDYERQWVDRLLQPFRDEKERREDLEMSEDEAYHYRLGLEKEPEKADTRTLRVSG